MEQIKGRDMIRRECTLIDAGVLKSSNGTGVKNPTMHSEKRRAGDLARLTPAVVFSALGSRNRAALRKKASNVGTARLLIKIDPP